MLIMFFLSAHVIFIQWFGSNASNGSNAYKNARLHILNVSKYSQKYIIRSKSFKYEVRAPTWDAGSFNVRQFDCKNVSSIFFFWVQSWFFWCCGIFSRIPLSSTFFLIVSWNILNFLHFQTIINLCQNLTFHTLSILLNSMVLATSSSSFNFEWVLIGLSPEIVEYVNLLS